MNAAKTAKRIACGLADGAARPSAAEKRTAKPKQAMTSTRSGRDQSILAARSRSVASRRSRLAASATGQASPRAGGVGIAGGGGGGRRRCASRRMSRAIAAARFDSAPCSITTETAKRGASTGA